MASNHRKDTDHRQSGGLESTSFAEVHHAGGREQAAGECGDAHVRIASSPPQHGLRGPITSHAGHKWLLACGVSTYKRASAEIHGRLDHTDTPRGQRYGLI
mmetsp:Transcript_46284/g.92388  ORF Transcript_46284/g.92388 Transcript_46284/m.92388 type:complete len:101 (-) Transcript_46284:156-458(-)